MRDTIIDEVHQAMVAAIGFHLNQPEHMLLANKKWNEQMRVAARAAVQEVAEQIGRKLKAYHISEADELRQVARELTTACLKEPS